MIKNERNKVSILTRKFFIASIYVTLEKDRVNMRLTQDMMKVLEDEHFLAYLCTAGKDGKPSARLVGVLPSEDMSQIYIGNGRLNKAEKDLNENKRAMIVFYGLSTLKVTGYKLENYLDIKGFQLKCRLRTTIQNRDDPIFKSVYDITKEAVNEEEAKLLKSVHVFEIEQIFDCSVEGGSKTVTKLRLA